MDLKKRKKLIIDYVWNAIDPCSFEDAEDRNYKHCCAICAFPYSTESLKNAYVISLSRMVETLTYEPQDDNGIEERMFYICSSCERDITIEESIYEQEESIIRDIKLYLETGRLPDMVASFDLFRSNAETNCVFCTRVINDSEKTPGKLVVPQGNSRTILSYVFMCSHCQDLYDKIADKLPDQGLYMDECPNCSYEYPVTTDEFQVRIYNNLLNYYCCNDCCANENITGMNSTQTTECDNCGKVQTIEITSIDAIKALQTGASVADILRSVNCNSCRDKIRLADTYKYEGSSVYLFEDTDGFQYIVDEGKTTEVSSVTPYEKKYAALLAAFDLIDWRKKTNYGNG